MKAFVLFIAVALCSLLLTLTCLAQGTAFTYQGRLNANGSPAAGLYDFRFRLASDSLGNTILETTATNGVPVTNGLFTASIDFGAEYFKGSACWLEVDVRTNGATSYTALSPLQAMMATPYATFANTASNLSGTLPAAQLTGAIPLAQLSGPVLTNNEAAVNLAGTFTGSGAGLSAVNAATVGGLGAASFWQVGGNSVTPGQFLGSANNQPVELWADGQRALRLEPTPGGAPNVIGGSPVNFVAGGVLGATIGGGGAANNYGFAYTNSVAGDFGTVAGGLSNTASSYGATVSGGALNIATNDYATVGGGFENAASAYMTTIGGGFGNVVPADYATVGGGSGNAASDWMAMVGGGYENVASGYAAMVGGGFDNVASGLEATVGGGVTNTASGDYATSGGGVENSATGPGAVVAGGGFDGNTVIGNTASGAGSAVGGGTQNVASGSRSTIGGGHNNLATNWYATVPGGAWNVALGQGSFAAGRAAKAVDDGSFVWNDNSTYNDLYSWGANTVTMHATGGYQLYSGDSSGVSLAAGSGSWTSMSDRNAKENFAPVDPGAVLQKVAALPMTTWNYKSQAASIRHIGPMAQDFKAAFAVGESDKGITTIDSEGVALAAIQGLNQKLEEKDAQIQAQSTEIQDLKARLERLEQLIRPQNGGER